MLLENLTQEFMSSRRNAWLAALLFSLLPLLSWVSAIIMGLVTLRKGAREGLWLLGVISFATFISAALFGQLSWWVLWNDWLGNTFLVWLFAVALRMTGSWARLLQIAMLLSILAILIVHMHQTDVYQWWLGLLHKQIAMLQQLGGLSGVVIPEQRLSMLAHMATGLQVAVSVVLSLSSVLAARWLQARLYNPGGLRKELLALRLDKLSGLLTLGCGIAAVLLHANMAIDLFPVMLLPCVLVGFCLMHNLFCKGKLLRMITFYVLLVTFPLYIPLLLAVFAIADSWLDLRRRHLLF